MAGTTYTVIVSNGISFNYTGIYDVTAYGAVGDGTTDDSGAFQAAINAAEVTGGKVFFGAADYSIQTELVIDSDNVHFSGGGPGSRLLTANDNNTFWIQISGDNIKLSDFSMVGSITDTDTTYNEAIEIKGTADNCTIRDVFFTGTSSAAGYSTGIRGRAGASDVKIVNCDFEYIRGTASGYGYGVQLAGVTGGIMTGNTSTFAAAQGRHHYYISGGCNGFVITGNTATGGISSGISVYSTSAQNPCENCVISNNTLNDTGAATSGAITLSVNCNNNIVANNIIIDANGYGVYLNNTSSGYCNLNSVSNNTIIDPADTAIFNNGGHSAHIVGNLISGVSGAAAISLAESGTADTDKCHIIGNNILTSSHTYALIMNGQDSYVKANTLTTGTSGQINNGAGTTYNVTGDNFDGSSATAGE